MAGQIFNIISNLPFLKRLELIEMRLEDPIDVFLNIPNVTELKISFDAEYSTKKDINFSIKTLCKEKKITLKSLKNI